MSLTDCETNGTRKIYLVASGVPLGLILSVGVWLFTQTADWWQWRGAMDTKLERVIQDLGLLNGKVDEIRDAVVLPSSRRTVGWRD